MWIVDGSGAFSPKNVFWNRMNEIKIANNDCRVNDTPASVWKSKMQQKKIKKLSTIYMKSLVKLSFLAD